MYAYLEGKFTFKSPALVYVDVNGVGFEVNISLHTFLEIQSKEGGKLFTHLQVKEDAHTLFGFSGQHEKDIFLLLTSVSGVGAATARMMLSSLKPDEVAKAILHNDVRLLESVKGIGKKTAERLVLELRDKLAKQPLETNISTLKNNTLQQDALNALTALGINRQAAGQALEKTLAANPNLSVEELIKKALRTL